MARLVRLAALLAAAAAPGGCVLFAERPQTPARPLTRTQLNDPPPPPAEKYYAILFGAQAMPLLRPDLTHSWLAVVKATDVPGCAPALQVDTLSWMPATLVIEVFRFVVEPGRNLTLPETLDWTQKNGLSVSAWGPYQLETSEYRRVLIHKAFMESGRVGYQCIDTVGEAGRAGNGSDCIHAISNMDPAERRARNPLIFYGKSASRRLTYEMARRQAFTDPWTEHDWLLPRLGLDKVPVEREPQPYKGLRRQIDPERRALFPGQN